MRSCENEYGIVGFAEFFLTRRHPLVFYFGKMRTWLFLSRKSHQIPSRLEQIQWQNAPLLQCLECQLFGPRQDTPELCISPARFFLSKRRSSIAWDRCLDRRTLQRSRERDFLQRDFLWHPVVRKKISRSLCQSLFCLIGGGKQRLRERHCKEQTNL